MMPRHVSLVLSGGIALGAYQAGAYARLHDREDLRPQHIAGSSIGAVNAALIAGSEADERVNRMRAFWNALSKEPDPFWTPWLSLLAAGPWRHAHHWTSVLQTRLFGRAGVFRPCFPVSAFEIPTSLYDLTPFRATLEAFVDFDRLNGGDVRLSIVTTDIESGEPLVFDTRRGDRIGPDHLLATCGFLPDFAPIEIDGRLLGDGGLVTNAPLEAVLLDEQPRDGEVLCFVLDLFSPTGRRPANLEEAANRRWELIFGNQTRQRLRVLEREYRLRWALARLSSELRPELRGDPEITAVLGEAPPPRMTVIHLSYRSQPDEGGPEKPFNFSRTSLADRWQAGVADMDEAIRLASHNPPAKAGISVRSLLNGGK